MFEVHAVDGAGQVVLRKTLRRAQMTNFFAGLPPCLVGSAPRRITGRVSSRPSGTRSG